MSIDLSEIFLSIQGESTHAGRRCVMVRLAGCDVRCSWCDTKYAWDSGEKTDIDFIIDHVKKYRCNLVEVTGGEPLLQEETPILLNGLLREGFEVLLETSGTRDIGVVPSGVTRIVDVKCPSAKASRPFLNGNVELLSPPDEVKLVIADKKDYKFAVDFVTRAGIPSGIEIIFSPVYGLLDSSILAEWILEDGLDVRLQIQMHKIIWGNKRGR